MKHKIGLFAIILVITLMIGLFVFLFFNCISSYSEFDLEYDELMYQKLTFEKYEVKVQLKAGDIYELYFEEYNEPFQVTGITQKSLDKKALKELEQGTAVEVYYCESSSRNYRYSICEIKCASATILDLSDYIAVNQNNQIMGIILCPIMVLIGLFLMGVFIRIWRFNNRLNKQGKNIKLKSNLWKEKIVYRANGNVIRVYNSPDVCSLVINDKIVDQYIGIVGGPFCLSGELKLEGKKIPVEAKMGHLMMRLYFDGQCVAKKFMGLG